MAIHHNHTPIRFIQPSPFKGEFASSFRNILMTAGLKEKSKNPLSLSETIIQYI
jgi:hypothetical protein